MFIVLEGLDGCGGETQARLLRENCSAKTFEFPDYNDDFGQKLKSFLKGQTELSLEMKALLYLASFVKNKEDISNHDFVVADRFFTSTLVYQGIEGLSQEDLLRVAEIFKLPRPDLIVYLRITPEESQRRKQAEHGELDRHEADAEFLGKVMHGYDQAAEKNLWSRWVTIDGTLSREEIHQKIKSLL
jgi:dTMP kinase